MEKEILKTIKYFSFFNYAPTFEEIYTFIGKKTSKKALQEELERLSDIKVIIQFSINRHYNLDILYHSIVLNKLKCQMSNVKSLRIN